MYPVYPTYGFASGHPGPYVLEGSVSSFCAQGYPGGYPNTLGSWCVPSYEHEVNPWSWEWTRTQQDPFIRYPYEATITQPLVQPTYVGLPQQTFSSVVGWPVPNANSLEVVCPRPIYPPPMWINMAGWDDEGTPDLTPSLVDSHNIDWEGEDYDEELGAPRRFLPSFLFSPDPEDLPAPFFPPSRDSTPSSCTLASLSPNASDLPQPHFDLDPHPPISKVKLGSSAPGVIPQPSSQSGSLESSMLPGPRDLPPPSFETCCRFRAGGFELGVPPDRRRRWADDRGTGDHTGRGTGKGMWKNVAGERRRVSGPRHHGGRLDLTWGR